MLIREKCPVCTKRSTNSHDPMGRPKLLRCGCGNTWHTPRYAPDIPTKEKAA